jgi:hypothetical protein
MQEKSVEGFWEYLRGADFRFYQQRDLGLDLYHAGWPGILLAALAVASGVVFLLAIFHVITARRHAAGLLLGLGLLAGSAGLATSYAHWKQLAAVEARIIRETAGPRPANAGQRAAVVALPLVVGAGNLAACSLGCLYLAAFWGTSLVTRRKGKDPQAAG